MIEIGIGDRRVPLDLGLLGKMLIRARRELGKSMGETGVIYEIEEFVDFAGEKLAQYDMGEPLGNQRIFTYQRGRDEQTLRPREVGYFVDFRDQMAVVGLRNRHLYLKSCLENRTPGNIRSAIRSIEEVKIR